MLACLRLAGPVHDAAHHRDVHLLDARVALAPDRHLLAQVASGCPRPCAGRRSTSCARSPGHAVTCGAKLRSPSDCRICCATSTSSVRSPFGLRRERDADRVADALGEQDRRAPAVLATTPFVPMPGLGEPEVQRVVAARARAARYTSTRSCTCDTLAEIRMRSCAEPDLLGERGRAQRALEHRLDVDVLRVARLRRARVRVHHLREQVLVERAPVHADAHRLVVLDGDLDDRAEVLVAPLAADVARVDAVLGERARAVRDTSRAAGARCSGSRRRSARRRRRSASRAAISGTAAAASSLFTVTRTSCEPAARERRDLLGGRRRRRRCRCSSSTARRPDAPIRRARRRRGR